MFSYHLRQANPIIMKMTPIVNAIVTTIITDKPGTEIIEAMIRNRNMRIV